MCSRLLLTSHAVNIDTILKYDMFFADVAMSSFLAGHLSKPTVITMAHFILKSRFLRPLKIQPSSSWLTTVVV